MTARFSTLQPGITEHAQRCYQPQHAPCRNEPTGQHRWSGWPGAYCLLCGAADLNELCLANCRCVCHDAWHDEFAKNEGGTP